MRLIRTAFIASLFLASAAQAKGPRDIPVTLAPREHRDYLWLPYREAADKCFSPSNAEAILQLPQRIAMSTMENTPH